MRNAYSSALKRRRTKSEINTPWKFEQEISFLKDYMQMRTEYTNFNPGPSSSQSDQQEEYSSDDDQSDTAAITITTFDLSDGIKSPSEFQETYNFVQLHDDPSLKKYKNDPDLDDTDYFFLTISKSVKKLPILEQTRIKLDIHRDVYNSGIQHMSRNEIDLDDSDSELLNFQYNSQNNAPVTKFYAEIDAELQELVQNPESLLL